MNISVLNDCNDLDRPRPIFRTASIFSFIAHFLIILYALYGLPNFGRKLPPNLSVIAFELLPVVKDTNLQPKKNDYNPEKIIEKIKPVPIKNTKPAPIKNQESERNKQLIPKEILPDVPKNNPVDLEVKLPSKKPKIILDKNNSPNKPKVLIPPKQKPILQKAVSKPLMKPEIVKSKIKKVDKVKTKTNPSALTSVLKTLEKIKESKEKEKEKETKRKDAASNLKDMVADAVNSKPKSLLKPFGISEINVLQLHLEKYWLPPIGAAGAENLIVDIFMELNKEGYVLKAEWVNKGLNGSNTFYKAAANAAIRAVKDAEPMPLPSSKYNEWKTLIFKFDPCEMFAQC